MALVESKNHRIVLRQDAAEVFRSRSLKPILPSCWRFECNCGSFGPWRALRISCESDAYAHLLDPETPVPY